MAYQGSDIPTEVGTERRSEGSPLSEVKHDLEGGHADSRMHSTHDLYQC